MKNLCLIAALGAALSPCAQAAQVSVSGIIDTGLNYVHTSYSNMGRFTESTDTLAMQSGQHNGSRLVFSGSEDLANGFSVEFKLENGFSSDTGALGQDGQLFGREARLTLAHTNGMEVSFGRMATITSNTGTYGVFWDYADALSGGWGGTRRCAQYRLCLRAHAF